MFRETNQRENHAIVGKQLSTRTAVAVLRTAETFLSRTQHLPLVLSIYFTWNNKMTTFYKKKKKIKFYYTS